MIRKLRLKFVCVNMLIVTVMMSAIFGLVYHFIRIGLENQSLTVLQSVAEDSYHPNRPGEWPGEVQLPFFVLELDKTGTLTAAGGGYYDLTDREFLLTLIRAVEQDGGREGILPAYGLRYCRGVVPRGERIAFADMSGERATLEHLGQICGIVGALCFAAFLLISWLLARWAVRPVEKAWQQQRQFVADASHELKTPLTVIMTNAELLNSPDFDEVRRNQFADYILTMSRQMRGLIEEMLELARTDSGQPLSGMESVNLSQLLQETVLPFEPLFFERGLTLDTRIAEGVTVVGSPRYLQQVAEILLDNARKYSDVPGEVLLSLARHGGRCRMEVSNPGPALSGEEQRNVFKRFYRADAARTGRGSYGLGLSIAENIARQHRGRIGVESKNGRNTFFLELPAK